MIVSVAGRQNDHSWNSLGVFADMAHLPDELKDVPMSQPHACQTSPAGTRNCENILIRGTDSMEMGAVGYTVVNHSTVSDEVRSNLLGMLHSQTVFSAECNITKSVATSQSTWICFRSVKGAWEQHSLCGADISAVQPPIWNCTGRSHGGPHSSSVTVSRSASQPSRRRAHHPRRCRSSSRPLRGRRSP